MKNDFQLIDGLINDIQTVISKDRCLCSDSKDVLEKSIVFLQESKNQSNNTDAVNWLLVFKALKLIAELFIPVYDLIKHIS